MQKIVLSTYDHNTIVKKKLIDFVFIKLNTVCNASCSFCDCWQTKKHEFVLNVDRLVEQLLAANPTEINLSGGEVVLVPQFWPLLEKSAGKLRWSITTNGTLLTKKHIDRIYQLNVRRLFISIDSVNAEQHNLSRGIPNLLQKINRAIEYIKETYPDIVIIINHVITNLNIAQISEFLLFYKKMKVDGINLIPIKDTPHLFVKEEQIHKLYHNIQFLINNHQISEDFFVNSFYHIFGKSESAFEKASKGIYLTGHKTACLMPYTTVFIDAQTGNVYPCDTTMWRQENQQYIMGNLKDQTLQEIWNGSIMSRFRDEMYPQIKYPCIYQCDPNNKV